MKAKNTYVALGVVFFVSVTAIVLPVGATIRVVAAIPAAGSLCAALLQVFRDMIAHERALWIIEAQRSFSIGATSHLAEVAFDKYALFCEEYIAEMFRTLATLTRDGPRQQRCRTLRRSWKSEELGSVTDPDTRNRIGTF